VCTVLVTDNAQFRWFPSILTGMTPVSWEVTAVGPYAEREYHGLLSLWADTRAVEEPLTLSLLVRHPRSVTGFSTAASDVSHEFHHVPVIYSQTERSVSAR
jgi:hypothetical protein